ncbi:MAG: energy-coupling factor ABC transporter permease [Anaerolineales bacterium]|nr:energy-coupling factor ABC transporter permease [Anaerolineales bacterium]
MHYSPAHMHIPDNFLSVTVALVCWLIAISALWVAVSKTNKSLGEKQIPLMGVMAAFIFAAQMINFPIFGGTSGHLLGGALAAIMLGPWAAMLVMTAVIAVQALLFQDGGVAVMGANILNMGLVTAAIGYGLYRATSSQSKLVKFSVAGFAAWLSVIAGALLASLQIWLSGNARLQIILPAMLFIHAFIGLGEALITVAALSFIMRTRPDLLGDDSESAKGGRGWILAGGLISLAVIFLSPFASADPDGLERVAANIGLIGANNPAPLALIPDYALPFLGQTAFSTIGAGMIGIIVVGAIAFLIGRGMKIANRKS